MSADDFNAKDYNDIHRIIKQLREEFLKLGHTTDDLAKQERDWFKLMAQNIHQMKAAVIQWEQVQHYQDERLRANKEEKEFRTKMNMMENSEYFRQIRRNMEIRHSHQQFGETMALTTKALFGGGIGLASVFNSLTKGTMSVMHSQKEAKDLQDDINNARATLGDPRATDRQRSVAKDAMGSAKEELKRLLESPESQLGQLKVFGKSISDRLTGAGEYFRRHKLGIMVSVGSIGLLITGMKLLYNTSPMMQASVKLLKLIWNLGLRPIGDFFGFVMRPIFVMLLRNFILPWYKVAYPFYQKWGNKIGEFLTNPSIEGFFTLVNDMSKEGGSLSILSAKLALVGGALGIGGLILSIEALKKVIDKITGKGSTPKTTNTQVTKQGDTTKYGNPADKFNKVNRVHSVAGELDYETAKKEYVKNLEKNDQKKPASAFKGNLGKVQQAAMNSWQQIQRAAGKFGKSLSWQVQRFENVLKNNSTFKAFNNYAKSHMAKTGGMSGMKGGKMGGVGIWGGYIPIITELMFPEEMQKINDGIKSAMPWFDSGEESSGSNVMMPSAGISPRANGGMINEPILGIGKSGQRYSFGERGAEMITPMGSGVGGTAITINIQNMSGSQQDLNNLRATILAVIQEANTRSGRI